MLKANGLVRFVSRPQIPLSILTCLDHIVEKVNLDFQAWEALERPLLDYLSPYKPFVMYIGWLILLTGDQHQDLGCTTLGCQESKLRAWLLPNNKCDNWSTLIIHSCPSPINYTCGVGPFLCWRKGQGHKQDPINQVCFSPDGQWVASASFDNSVKLWNGTTGKFVATFRHVLDIYQISWSADSRLLLSGSKDSTLKVWDIRTRKLKEDLPGHVSEVYCVDWSPDGEKVASGGKDKVMKLWMG
ncbi:hypothetical protein TSUD_402060 [Trifolium subterraneum]|uniref:Uncharacterized protein n=1 Tax=Trifolium subterraneum TaxID=3900 RepID=A0A2Z6NQ42_TRISU|nr:hypothetical protein TSUD_402060 [Trifolium subterraneum]